VLGAFFFCLVMSPVYASLGALLGIDGALYAYSDDVYLVSDPVNMPIALGDAPAISKRVGLRIGWVPCKTQLILPPRCDSDAFLQQLDAYGEGLPHIVPGFSACLGIPRHANNDPEFITVSLECLGVRNRRLLDLVEAVADDGLFAAIRLLQVCRVQWFGHIINAVTSPLDMDSHKHATRGEILPANRVLPLPGISEEITPPADGFFCMASDLVRLLDHGE